MAAAPPGGALISDGRVVAPEVRGAGNPRTIEPQDAENSAETPSWPAIRSGAPGGGALRRCAGYARERAVSKPRRSTETLKLCAAPGEVGDELLAGYLSRPFKAAGAIGLVGWSCPPRPLRERASLRPPPAAFSRARPSGAPPPWPRGPEQRCGRRAGWTDGTGCPVASRPRRRLPLAFRTAHGGRNRRAAVCKVPSTASDSASRWLPEDLREQLRCARRANPPSATARAASHSRTGRTLAGPPADSSRPLLRHSPSHSAAPIGEGATFTSEQMRRVLDAAEAGIRTRGRALERKVSPELVHGLFKGVAAV